MHLLIILGVCLTYIGIDFFISEQLYAFSQDFTRTIQPKISGTFFHWILVGASAILSEAAAPAYVLILYYFYSSKTAIYRLLITISFCTYINSISKMYYKEPRPYYNAQGIPAKTCSETDFGRPSGHSSTGLLLFVLL